ncbi:MAG: ABC transporter substrate-binding protein [Myxococcales bacterium]|nr:ABC transporter substrate-binding protein [Myxococcales bacterium]
MRTPFVARVCLSLVLTLAAPAAAVAQEVPPAVLTATQFVEQKGDEIIAILNQRPTDEASRAQRIANLRRTISEFINIEVLAEEALGAHWEARTPAERAEFTSLLRDLIETSYSQKLGDEGIAPGSYTVTWDSERSRNGRTRVEATVTYDGEPHAVEVIMREATDGSRVVFDLVTDDVSLRDSYAESFDNIITEHGWGELISRMQERLAELRAA